jgi:hypothetical protein
VPLKSAVQRVPPYTNSIDIYAVIAGGKEGTPQ